VIRNIIFDWSGTLVNDLPAVWRATNHVFGQAGIAELTIDQFRAEFCLPFTRFYERHLPDVSTVQLETWYHGAFKQVQYSVVELPHSREFLEFCKAREIRTFLLSTIHRDHYAVQGKVTGFDQFIGRPYVEILDKRAKIKEILEENRLKREETLFIGDMQHDVETAKHGGIHSCAVLTGYNTLAQLRAADPDLIVEHLGELQQILERNGFELQARPGSEPDKKQPIVTVGALIFNEQGEALMVQTHKWSDLWGIPGGKTRFGETSVDALRREIKEETDLEITDVEFVLVQDCINSREFYREAHFVLLNYTCRCVGVPVVRLNEEAVKFQWVSLDDSLKMPLNMPTRVLVEAVQKKPH
jgi:phosphoglycolate phosphatase-like HAD superfamily hydrolase/ADP-ribose pyrophosphatase YjhB (NUDIX family)